jgi:hypothetical protein
MNRLTSGTVLTIALLGMAACSGDPTGDLRNGPEKLVASPSQLFLDVGRSATVEVGAVDDQGNPIEAAYVATNVGSNLSVKRDSTFLPVFVNDSQLEPPAEAPRFRFIVTANAFGASSFTVEGAGKSISIPVQVVPSTDFAATFSTTTPALGETIVLTAAPGTHFTDSSLVIIGDTLNPPRTLAVAPDGSTISFLLPPNVNSPVSVTNVVADAAPTLVFTPATIDLIQSPVYDSVSVGFSTTTPAIGQTVTATITDNPLIKFDTTAASVGAVPVLTFPGQFTGPAAGPAAVTMSADSSSLSFQAPPNANGPASVVSFVFPGGYVFPLPTKTGIATTPALADTADITLSNATPAVLEAITITLPASLKFSATAADDSVIFAGKSALIQSVGGGGTSISIIPLPGSTGQPQLVGVFPTGFPQFSLSVPGDESVTVPDITPLAGTEDPATAPELTIPTAGNTVTINDAGSFDGPGDCCFGGPTRFYKLTIAAPTTLTFTLDWFEGQDLGVYITESDALTVIDSGDSGLEGPTGHPEAVTVTLAPGTYFAAIPNFSASNPSVFQLSIHNP